MEFQMTSYKRCEVLKTSGRIDSSTAPKLEEAIKNVTDRDIFKIVFDMSDVTFMSSAGWWILINTQKNCKRYNRGELILVGVAQNICESLELVGMGSYFKIFDTVVDAVGFF